MCVSRRCPEASCSCVKTKTRRQTIAAGGKSISASISSARSSRAKITVERKFDGTKGWTLDSMQGDSEITGNQLEGLKNSIFPSPLLNYKANGMSVDVAASQQVNGKNAIVLKLTAKTGPPVTVCLDP